MQVKNKRNISKKYPDKILHNQGSIDPMEQGVSLPPALWATIIVTITKHILPLWGRLFQPITVKLNTGMAFLAAGIHKEHPQRAHTYPNVKDEHAYFGNKFNFLHEFMQNIRKRVELLKIKRKINKMQRIIAAPTTLRPSYASTGYDVNSYFIEIDNKGVMRLIETHKDRVHEVRRTKDMDELLYWIFTNITFTMACKDKVGNNADGYDHRKHIFLVQEELLGKLNPHWKEKKHAEYKAFFKKYPVDNIPGEGASYFDALRKLVRSETVENTPNYFRFQ